MDIVIPIISLIVGILIGLVIGVIVGIRYSYTIIDGSIKEKLQQRREYNGNKDD